MNEASRKKSKYAEKRARGNQMYGPGCCGHSITSAQLEKRRTAAKESGHKFWVPGRPMTFHSKA